MAIKIPPFSYIAYCLTSLFTIEKGKYRGNFGRLILAVHAVFSDSGFVLSNDLIILSPLSPLRYSLSSVGPTAVVDFSQNDTIVTVTAMFDGDDDNNTDDNPTVYKVSFDLANLAGPLISCIHGAIGDSQEKVIADFWREVRSKLVDPLEIAALRSHSDSDSDGNVRSKPAPVRYHILQIHRV